MIDQERFRVEVDVRGSPRKVLLTAPKGFNLVSAARAFKGLASNLEVQEKLAALDKDCGVEVLASQNEMVGISVPDECPEEKV